MKGPTMTSKTGRFGVLFLPVYTLTSSGEDHTYETIIKPINRDRHRDIARNCCAILNMVRLREGNPLSEREIKHDQAS